jgi:hypothetical protein
MDIDGFTRDWWWSVHSRFILMIDSLAMMLIALAADDAYDQFVLHDQRHRFYMISVIGFTWSASSVL